MTNEEGTSLLPQGVEMALPITGPTNTLDVRDIDAMSSYRLARSRYKQPKPYNLVAPYAFHKLFCGAAYISGWGTQEDYPSNGFGGFANVNTGKSPATYAVSPNMITDAFTNELNFAINFARAKFLASLGSTAELAVNFAERKQAMGMVTNRVLQLVRAAGALRRSGPLSFLSELTLNPDESLLRRARARQKKWSRSKDFANVWLEYHFGWEPIVRDIYSAIDFLQKPIPLGKVSAFGKRVPLSVGSVQSEFSGNYFGTSAQTTNVNNLKGWIGAQVGGDVLITNPNLYLANRLGITNPALIAWELVPYSFVVDWFLNIGDFLKSFSDGLGISVTNPFTAWKAVVSSATWVNYSTQYGWFVNPDAPQGFRKAIGGTFKSITSDGVWSSRVSDIPIVKLGLRPPWDLSVSRGVTAISLLIQRL